MTSLNDRSAFFSLLFKVVIILGILDLVVALIILYIGNAFGGIIIVGALFLIMLIYHSLITLVFTAISYFKLTSNRLLSTLKFLGFLLLLQVTPLLSYLFVPLLFFPLWSRGIPFELSMIPYLLAYLLIAILILKYKLKLKAVSS